MEGLLSTGPTLSSYGLFTNEVFFFKGGLTPPHAFVMQSHLYGKLPLPPSS